MLNRVLWPLLVFAAAFLYVTAVQVLSGAYSSEFGAHPDEAAHVVSGVMVHDYLVKGFPRNPLAFANAFQEHYPKIAIGNWPPLFYAFQALYYFVVPAGHVGVMTMLATVTAALATTLYFVVRPRFGVPLALTAAALVVAMPLVRQHYVICMAENFLAIFVLLAVVFFGRYLDTGRLVHGLAFGFVSACAIMTKGSGFALALLPPLAILIGWRWDLLRLPSLWLSGLLTGLLVAPWTLAFIGQNSSAWAETLTVSYFFWAWRDFPLGLVVYTGYVLVIPAAIGAWATLGGNVHGERGLWVASAAGIVGYILFHSIVPANVEVRYMVPAIPLMILFAIAGLDYALRALGNDARLRAGVLTAVALGFCGIGLLQGWPKVIGGFRPFAEEFAAGRVGDGRARILISADANGEGQFISELALIDKRNSHVVSRSSKAFADSTWMGYNYKPKATSPAELVRVMSDLKIDYVLVDTSVRGDGKLPHHDLMKVTLAALPAHFELLRSGDLHREGWSAREAIRLYRLKP